MEILRFAIKTSSIPGNLRHTELIGTNVGISEDVYEEEEGFLFQSWILPGQEHH